jgi:hypothetical protein
MLCAATVSATADAPFALNTDTPDYVVTRVERIGAKQTSSTVTHHGDWTRVDTIQGVYRTTDYFLGNVSLQISGPGNGFDDRMYVGLKLHPQEIGWDTEPSNTGKRETFLGESCTVWSAGHAKLSYLGSQLEKLSCLTDDGIELWSRFVGKYGVTLSSEATSIERRPVTVDEVRPPQNLLALGWWDNEEAKASLFHPDFEAVLEVRNGMPTLAGVGGPITRTIRRHYPWTYIEDKDGGILRRLAITHAYRRMELSFVGPGGRGDAESSLMIWRRPSAEQSVSGIKPKDMGHSETILGEECRWFDLMPGIADAGSAECRTNDGIPLKQSTWSRGGGTVATAISLARRPLALDDVRPPKDMLSLDRWTQDHGDR